MAEMIPDDQGHIRVITQAAPAAGAEVIIPAIPRIRFRLINFLVEFAADVNAADRSIYIRIMVGSDEIARFSPRSLVTANQTRFVNYSDALGNVTGTGGVMVCGHLPTRLLLNNEANIETVTAGLQTGDQFGIPQMLIEEWIEPLV